MDGLEYLLGLTLEDVDLAEAVAEPELTLKERRANSKRKALSTRRLGRVWGAAQTGDVAELRKALGKLVELGLNVNSLPRGRMWAIPPLWVAACNNHAAAVRELVAAKAGVNVPSMPAATLHRQSSRTTPLWIAAQKGSLAAMDALLAAKADAELGGPAEANRSTPLIGAAAAGEPAAVARLLQARAAVHTDTGVVRRGTALGAAAQYGHVAVLQILLHAKADMQQDHFGSAPLVDAAGRGHVAVVEELLRAKVSANRAHPLHAAAGAYHRVPAQRRDAVVRALVRAKAALGHIDEQGMSVLATAAKSKHGAVEMLLRAKADPNQAGPGSIHSFGATPLQIAAVNGHHDHVRPLLACKARLGGVLYSAAASFHAGKALQLLLQAKAAVNEPNERGESPLWKAAASGSNATVCALLDAKAVPDQAAADGSTPLVQTARRQWGGSVETLVKAKASVNRANRAGHGPLWAAAMAGDGPALQLLLRAKADPNPTGAADGSSPLCAAARSYSKSAVSLLLNAKAAVNAADAAGRTALWLCAASSNEPAVRALLLANAVVDHAAEVEATAGMGAEAMAGMGAEAGRVHLGGAQAPSTPLYVAVLHGSVSVVEVLLDAKAAVDLAHVETALRNRNYGFGANRIRKAARAALRMAAAEPVLARVAEKTVTEGGAAKRARRQR